MRRTIWTAILLLMIIPLWGAVVPGRWEKVDALDPGTDVMVILKKTGRRIEGAFDSSGPERLTIRLPGAGESSLFKRDIQEVLAGKPDAGLVGLLAGAALGGGAGALIGYGRRTFECWTGCSVAIGVTLFAPIGAVLGWLADRDDKRPDVLYRSAR